MKRGGLILGIIGIVIGVGGLGFGIVNFIDQPTVYYSYRAADYTPTPALQYIAIPDIAIVFEIGGPVSLHLLFTCSARCYGDAGSFSDLFFYFMINSVKQDGMPWARTGGYQSNTNYEYSTVSLQHYFTLTTPGTYNITVVVLSENIPNHIRQASLWIRSYPA